jgi:hypothetical protein
LDFRLTDGALYPAHVVAAPSMFGMQALELQFLALCMAAEFVLTLIQSQLSQSHFHLTAGGLFRLQEKVLCTYGMQDQAQSFWVLSVDVRITGCGLAGQEWRSR